MNEEIEEPSAEQVSEESCPPKVEPRWRPAAEPTCCGSDCDDCPF